MICKGGILTTHVRVAFFSLFTTISGSFFTKHQQIHSGWGSLRLENLFCLGQLQCCHKAWFYWTEFTWCKCPNIGHFLHHKPDPTNLDRRWHGAPWTITLLLRGAWTTHIPSPFLCSFPILFPSSFLSGTICLRFVALHFLYFFLTFLCLRLYRCFFSIEQLEF